MIKIIYLLIGIIQCCFVSAQNTPINADANTEVNRYQADADVKVKDGDYASAIPLLDNSLKVYGDNSYDYFLRGLCYFKPEQYSSAIPDF